MRETLQAAMHLFRLLTWLYRRLGSAYPVALVGAQTLSGLVVAAAAVLLLSVYFDAARDDLALVLGGFEALTALALALGSTKAIRRLRPVRAWIDGARGQEQTLAAWEVASTFPLRTLKRGTPPVIVLVALLGGVFCVLATDIGWGGLAPVVISGLVVISYMAVLHLLATEIGLRPVLVDLNDALPDEFPFERGSLPVAAKLMTSLPLINVITGVVVAGLAARGDGADHLGLRVLIAIGVALVISMELAITLSRSIAAPIEELREAVARVGEGDYDVRVPVTTTDEVGELTAGFNRMTRGLAEREQIREAFGTYLDDDVAELILSGGFPTGGVEVEVTILFCDVRDFTRFAARSEAQEVVAALNELFEQIVPVITRHSGHVDKFVGDGLLAVFGAPDNVPDHADQALEAAREIADICAEAGDEALQVGVGLNTGTVVAGNIGGGGRLNFSVIGDAVNVAARVESETRKLDLGVLLTAATREALQREHPLDSEGKVRLRGKDEPVELYSPRDGEPEPAERSEVGTSGADGG
ncbi:MAG: adenylate/guanylate cyclase domain-containing protein [Solirubrobacterales bacterium]